jgi:hypothetical protein
VNQKVRSAFCSQEAQRLQALHPAWIALIRHCMEMGYGEIERLKIQDGIPVMAEKSIQRIKLG